MPDFKLIEVRESPYLFVSRSCSMEPGDISRNMADAFKQVLRFMVSEGVPARGRALAVYHDYHPEKMSFRAGFAVDHEDLAKAKGEIEGDVTPAGQVLHFVHKGSYSTLRDDYGLMMKHVESIGRALGAPTWEVYLNAPGEVPEEELLTEVFSKLK